MTHLASVFGFIGRLYAIRCALDYDARELPQQVEWSPIGAVLWRTNMDAWRLAAMEMS